MFKKTSIAFAAALMLSSFSVSAQRYLSLGPVIGFGHSNVTNGTLTSNAINPTEAKTLFHPSFHAGVGLIYAKHEHWGLGGEVLFSQEGYTKEFSQANFAYREAHSVGYIRIPLRAYYFFGQFQDKVRPKVYLGPSFGIRTMENSELTTLSGAEVLPAKMHEFNTFDFGLQAGVGANVTLGKSTWLNLDLNYYQGLADALNDNMPTLSSGYNMNQKLALQVGLLFGLGSKGNTTTTTQ